MSAPALKVYLGFGSTWTTADASISWTDVTTYTDQNGISTNRGRSSELDEYQAGTAEVTLLNSDRRFDPLHAAGPYFGDLLPGVPIKITGTPSGLSEVSVFRGFVDGWPQDYTLGNTHGVSRIRATDGFVMLALAGLPPSVYAVEVAADSPDAWWRLGEAVGTTMLDSSGNRRDGTYGAGTTDLSGRHPNQFDIGTAIDFDTEHEGGADYKIGSRPCVIEFIMRTPDRPTSAVVSTPFSTGTGLSHILLYLSAYPAGTNWFGVRPADFWFLQMYLNDGSAANFFAGRIHENFDGAGIHVALRFPATTGAEIFVNGEYDADGVTSFTDAVSFSGSFTRTTVNGAGDSGLLRGNSTIADVAMWDSDIGTTRIAAHAAAFTAPWGGDSTGTRIASILDLIGWPSDLRDIATGLSTLGPVNFGHKALVALKRAEAAEQGRMFISAAGKLTFFNRYHHQTITAGSTAQATLSDDGSDIPYSSLGFDYDLRFVFNRIRGGRPGGTEVETSDATSIATFGERVDTSLSNVDFSSDPLARTATEYRLSKYKDPRMRVRPVLVKLHGRTAAQQATMLALELGYRVNLERTPQGVGSAIDSDQLIEGISHRISRGAWETTLTLSPASAVNHAAWGTATWGDDAAATEAIWGY